MNTFRNAGNIAFLGSPGLEREHDLSKGHPVKVEAGLRSQL